MRLFLALLILSGLAAPVAAADTTSAGMAARMAGATVRAQIWTGHLNEQHIWRFKPDGTVTGAMWAVESGWRSSRHININDQGTWRAENGRLCVTWRLFFGGGTQCYSLAAERPGWARFSNQSGGASFNGQISRD